MSSPVDDLTLEAYLAQREQSRLALAAAVRALVEDEDEGDEDDDRYIYVTVDPAADGGDAQATILAAPRVPLADDVDQEEKQ